MKIDRATTAILAMEAGLIPMPRDIDGFQRLCNLAVEHAAKDAEPVAWMYDWEAEGEVVLDWVSKDYDESHSPTMCCHNIRPLYTHPATDDTAESVQLLSEVFDAWENGTPCNEEDGGYIGTAFRLDDAVFHRCCDLLNRVNPPRNATDDTALLRQALEALTAPFGMLDTKLEQRAAITALRKRLGDAA